MIDWKTKINPIVITNHDIYKMICLYNTLTGECNEIERSGLKGLNKDWIGFYVKKGNDLIGVFATNKGPVFFINSNMYPLVQNDWDFDIEVLSSERNVFSFVYNGQEIYRLEYERTKLIGIHPYADEEFMDFFVWMSKWKESGDFLDFYTIN
ncbi:MAG: hypothetical protein ACI35O_16400 [Bacillaceae bacterium]